MRVVLYLSGISDKSPGKAVSEPFICYDGKKDHEIGGIEG